MSNMLRYRVAFRTDASLLIGLGHFMRCLTLASAFREHGAHVRFICRHLPVHMCRVLNEKGYEFKLLNSEMVYEEGNDLAHSSWLGVSQHVDAVDTIQALSDSKWDWIVVDHYALDIRWETALRGLASHIFVIDDLADRLHACDILLDDNLFPDIGARYINKVPTCCRLLLGPSYLPLRDEFLQLREKVKPRTGPVNHVLISFGGIDIDNYTSWAIEALINTGLNELVIDVVLGAQHPCRKQIQDECGRYSLNCHVQTNRMADLMNEADLAIGAAGYTSYEFAAMKLPAILIPTSDIQVIFAKEMENIGVARVPSVSRHTTVNEVSAAFLEVIDSAPLRSSMSFACAQVIDGKGSLRIIEELLSFRE